MLYSKQRVDLWIVDCYQDIEVSPFPSYIGNQANKKVSRWIYHPLLADQNTTRYNI